VTAARIRALAGLGLLAAALAGADEGGAVATATTGAPAALPPEAVAAVDGQAIPARIHRMYVRNGALALGLDAGTEDGRRRARELEQAVLDELVERALIDAEARHRGLQPPEAAIASRMRPLVAGMGAEAGYRAYLAEHGLSDEEFRATVVQELRGALLRDALTREVSVGEAELRNLYQKEKADPALRRIFVEPEQVEAAHVLVEARRSLIERRLRDEKSLAGEALARAVAEEVERRRARAEAVRRQALSSGAEFGELARRFSDDPSSRLSGGALGRFTRNAHTAAFDAAAFALDPGQIGLVQTEYGFHVLKVTSHTPERRRSFEQARPALAERLLARKRAQRLADWLAARRRLAVVTTEPSFNPPCSAPGASEAEFTSAERASLRPSR